MLSCSFNGHSLPLAVGQSILEAAIEAGQPAEAIPRSCPATGRCRECIVRIKSGNDALNPLTEAERFLERSADDESVVHRLACQARLMRGDIELEIETFRRDLHITTSGTAENIATKPWPELKALWNRTDHPIGVAVDIGTTTVVLHLIDLQTSKTRSTHAFENPQQFGGSDVMHRISYDQQHPGQMRATLLRYLNHALAQSNIDRDAMIAMAVAGNSTMRDLFFNLDVQPLGRSPFVSCTEEAVGDGRQNTTAITAQAAALGIEINPDAIVYGLPLISHHVGADTAAVLATLPIEQRNDPFLMIDLGTNSEVVAGRGDQLLAASCAAGPAFEGGRIGCGIPACAGAVTHVALADDGSLKLSWLGDDGPVGFCGTGLVDLVATLRESDTIDAMGRFANKAQDIAIDGHPRLRFSRQDAAELAQAKSATLLGQTVLMRRLNMASEDVANVYLAGAFASQLNTKSARNIGLIVPVDDERIHLLGNASVEGAKRVLLNADCRAELESLVKRVEHVSLEAEPDFFDLFAEMTLYEPLRSEVLQPPQ